MTTNTQPQTQQSGGDELKYTLMHTKVIVYTQGKEFFVNLGTVISYGDNWKVIMQHIEQATQARERAAEKRLLDKIFELSPTKNFEHWKPQDALMFYQRLKAIEQQSQAGEGGEV